MKWERESGWQREGRRTKSFILSFWKEQKREGKEKIENERKEKESKGKKRERKERGSPVGGWAEREREKSGGWCGDIYCFEGHSFLGSKVEIMFSEINHVLIRTVN